MSPAQELSAFYQSLAQLLRAGLPMAQALEACAGAFPAARPAARMTENGATLAEALAQFPAVFPEQHVQILAVAARTGLIDGALDDLAAYTDQLDQARRAVVGGVTLPLVMLHVAFVVAPLRAMLGGGSLGGYLGAVLMPVAVFWALVGGSIGYFRNATPAAQMALLSRIPKIRDAWSDLKWWQAMSALAMLSRTSLNVPQSLRFAARVCQGHPLSEALAAAAEVVERDGTPASQTLVAFPCVPASVASLWKNGEITGTLDRTFAQLSLRYAESFRARVKALSQWLPKLVYGGVALYLVWQIFHLAGAYLSHLNSG